jgi:hypothetical protein
MLNREGYDRIKKYVGWENKPDGAVDALVEIVTEAVVDSAAETTEQRIERGNQELGEFK